MINLRPNNDKTYERDTYKELNIDIFKDREFTHDLDQEAFFLYLPDRPDDKPLYKLHKKTSTTRPTTYSWICVDSTRYIAMDSEETIQDSIGIISSSNSVGPLKLYRCKNLKEIGELITDIIEGRLYYELKS